MSAPARVLGKVTMEDKFEFAMKCKAINNVIDKTCDVFVCGIKGEHQTSIQVKGSPADLMYIMHEIVSSLRDKMNESMPEELTEKLLSGILKTDEEIHEELEAKMKEKGIPDWLKKLMAEVNDDSTDEADDEEDEDESEEDDDDTGDTPDISVRVDIHHHNGDADPE